MSYEGSSEHIDKLTHKQALEFLHYIDEQDEDIGDTILNMMLEMDIISHAEWKELHEDFMTW